MYPARRFDSEGAFDMPIRALVFMDSISEADAIAETLIESYGFMAAPVTSEESARMALLEGTFDVLLAHVDRDLSWVSELAPDTAVIVLGRSPIPDVASLLIVSQWPQPLERLVEQIRWHLDESSRPSAAEVPHLGSVS
jgi:hypothetical protein